MAKRYVSIWFCHLVTDYFIKSNPGLKEQPFVLAAPVHGRMIITSASATAQRYGAFAGMVLADARAIIPNLQVLNEQPELPSRLLDGIGKWCIRYTPVVSIDPPDGLFLDVSGCPHLWGGEEPYIKDLSDKLQGLGYSTRVAMADTPGCAWAVARYSSNMVVEEGDQLKALLLLPPAALRLEGPILQRIQKLGLRQIRSFISMPRRVLQRRFGNHFLQRVDQALGMETEVITPIEPVVPYQERLPCLEPIRTATGIEIALQRLLDGLCERLHQEGKGARKLILKAICIDHRVEHIGIGTNRGSRHPNHLFKLFAERIQHIEPGLGIDLFILEAPHVEELDAQQEALWTGGYTLESAELAELLDRITNKFGPDAVHRYLPQQHHWPERCIKPTSSLTEKATSPWPNDAARPLQLLPQPEPIQVTAPIPDYPPISFRYREKLHKVKKQKPLNA